jgi:hypothetical protein
MPGRPDLGQNRPYLGLDLGDVALAQIRQPRRAPTRHRDPHRPQDRGPLRLDLARFDELLLQLLSLEFSEVRLRNG